METFWEVPEKLIKEAARPLVIGQGGRGGKERHWLADRAHPSPSPALPPVGHGVGLHSFPAT